MDWAGRWVLSFLIASFILIEIVNIHPGIVIGVLLVAALVTPDKKKKIQVQVEGKSESI